MAEASKIRLVRCPKCGHLQTEHSDYSVYQCVGCGAVLRAKTNRSVNGGFWENSIKEKTVEGSLCSLPETARESEEDRVFVRGNVDLVGVSSSRTEKEEFLVGNDHVNVGNKTKGFRICPNNFEREIRYVDNCRQSSKHPIDDQVGGDYHDLNGPKSVNSSVVEGIGEVPAPLGNSSKVMRSRVVFDNQGAEREGFGGFDKDLGSDAERSRFSSFVHYNGSSNCKSNSFYEHGKPVKNFDYRDVPNEAESLELNRAEFNRKLRDLKEQSSKLEVKPKENTLDDRNMGPSASYRDLVAYNVSMQPFFGDNHIVRPPNFNHRLGPAPFKNDHNLVNHNLYPSPRDVPRMTPRSDYEDPVQSQKLREHNNQAPPRYSQPPPLDSYLGRYMDFNQGVIASYPREPFLHQPACICLHCGNRNWHIPPVVHQTGCCTGRLAQTNFDHCANPVPRNHIPIGAVPSPFHSRDSQKPMRWPIDIDLDVDAFYQSHPRRVVVAHGNRRLCRPIAGGAPFMLCHNCLELLKLPRKVMAVANNLQKLQCGTCSTSYSFEIRNKRLIISIPVETEKISSEADDVSHNPLNGGILRTHVCSTDGGTYSWSIDSDSGYDLQSADMKKNLLLDQMSYLSEPEKRQGQTSSSSISKQEKKSLDNVIVQNDVSDSVGLPSKFDMPPTVSGSPFRIHFNDSAFIHGATGCGFGSRSKWTDQEKVVLNKIASQQNGEKGASMKPKVEVSFNQHLNTNLSHDSVEVSKVDQLSINKGHKTFLVGLIKQSFRDFSRSTQRTENGRPNVSVNGQLIPNRLIKKAEKHAGPIEPGEYWYDSRAGFWGVMGQPCHGIITPYIEEFSYPMPENCAAGNTSVFVNGRELHQIDLDLLTSRGLPAIRNKKYIIETSGRVLDGDSCEELVCLGKLAPTVEKIQRGFGMRVPKMAL